MKTLKTKKVNIGIAWNGLRTMPPKEFPSVAEMEATVGTIDFLKSKVLNLTKIMEESDKLNTDILVGKVKGDEINDRKMEFFKRANEAETKEGQEVIEIVFEDADFNRFFQQFERWGRQWFIKIDAYLEFRKDLNETNRQPKDKNR